jgi:hypothetical protein
MLPVTTALRQIADPGFGLLVKALRNLSDELQCHNHFFMGGIS